MVSIPNLVRPLQSTKVPRLRWPFLLPRRVLTSAVLDALRQPICGKAIRRTEELVQNLPLDRLPRVRPRNVLISPQDTQHRWTHVLRHNTDKILSDASQIHPAIHLVVSDLDDGATEHPSSEKGYPQDAGISDIWEGEDASLDGGRGDFKVDKGNGYAAG